MEYTAQSLHQRALPVLVRTCWIVLLGALLLFAATYSSLAGPLTLPDAGKVEAVRLEYAGGAVTRTGPGWIGLLLERMAAAAPTRKPTVQEIPNKDDLAAAHFEMADGSEQTFFFYPEKGGWYIEHPYEGVYKTDQILWEMVTDLTE